MYKMIIVDDEKVIRRGLVDLVSWPELGFSVEQDFEDGREAIEYLKSNEVHAVLTDVKMTDVSGLELAKWVYEHAPHIKVVIISGYKEFEYAQQAIQYNVSNYLLKPTKLDEIENVFSQVKLKLVREEQALAERRRSREWLPLLREQFFTDLLMGALRQPKELKKRIEAIGLPFGAADGCCIADVRLFKEEDVARAREAEHRRLIEGLGRLFQQQESGNVHLYPVWLRDSFKVIGTWNRTLATDPGRQLVEEQLEQIMSSAKAVFDFDIQVRVEYVYDSLLDLAVHSEAVRLTMQESSGKMRLEKAEYERLVTKYKLFISNVLEGNVEGVNSLMDRFFEDFRAVPVQFSHRLIRDLFSIIQHTLGQGGTDIKQLTSKVLDYDISYGGIDEIWSLGKHTVTQVMHTIASSKNESSKGLVEQARQYIGQHFQEDISLDNVADTVFLHPVYFSKLFKQHAGINFTEYLTRLRIDKAKELIQTGQYKMYEVGSMVGYPNSKYFYRVFKQTVGCTPTEYAERANGEKQL